MKLICDGLDLSDAVLKVSKALSVKSTNPVLEGIKITAKGDTLTLLATDMELTIEKTIKAEVLMEGATVVVGKYFVEFAKKLEKEQVELCRLNEGSLQIKYSESESELQVFPIDNYPRIEKETEGDYFELSQSDFKKIIERTVFACSADDSRPILKGCLFEICDGVLTSVALDGFRMAVVKKEVNASGNFKAVIPSRTLMEITRLLDKEDQTIRVVLQKNTLFINETNNKLTIIIPEDMVLSQAEINTGAGMLEIEALAAERLYLELGAGEVDIQNLIALHRAEIDGGLGEVTIRNGSLANLDMDMGMGELNLTSQILGNSELNSGIGAINLVLLGQEDDYSIDIDKGIGNATIEGIPAADDTRYGRGQNDIEIDCGIGNLNISFKPL